MLRHMFRSSVLLFTLLSIFSNSLFAAADKEKELSKTFLQAQNLVREGKIQQAISAYQSIIHSHPQTPEAYNNLAGLYLKQNNVQQAKAILEQGLNAHNGYARLYESLTSINIAMARDAYSKALQIDLQPTTLAITSLPLTESKTKIINDTIILSQVDKSIEKIQVVKEQAPAKASPAAEITPVSANEEKPANIKEKDSQSIELVLQAWSAAWSAQSTDIYLSFYHKDYQPEKGLSRQKWVQSRKMKLTKPSWIKVGLSDINIGENSGEQAVVNFKQIYQSNSFRDESRKQMVLLNTNNGWQILSEKSL